MAGHPPTGKWCGRPARRGILVLENGCRQQRQRRAGAGERGERTGRQSGRVVARRIVEWIRRRWAERRRGAPRPQRSFAALFQQFKDLLAANNRILELMAEANERLGGEYIFDQRYIETFCQQAIDLAGRLVFGLELLAPHRYPALRPAFERIRTEIEEELSGRKTWVSTEFVMHYAAVSRAHVDDVGAKNANLAEVGNLPGMRIPRGFAITSAACDAFLASNGLDGRIDGWLAGWRRGERTAEETAALIQQAVLAGRLPGKLARDLDAAVGDLVRRGVRRLVLRSSAWGEDGRDSFAGQFRTVLNVPPGGVASAYRQVVASLYGAAPMTYRQERGYGRQETVMAVGCQEAVAAVVSGVVYSRDPVAPERETLVVSALWGLGGPLVSGRARGDRFVVDRDDPSRTVEMDVVRKAEQEVFAPEGGLRREGVPEPLQTRACLTPVQIARVAQAALLIENAFKQPQDIEFAFDSQGELVILQARPLAIAPRRPIRSADLSGLPARHPVLIQGRGEVAQKGIAAGPVWVVRSEADLAGFPAGSVLVARHAAPVYARVLPLAAGLITEVGSVAGHLATVAREYRVPALFNCDGALDLLADCAEITLDAEENVVYQGVVKELLLYGLAEEPIEESREYRLLRRVLRKIEPLYLVDPAARSFRAEACRTLHDITRFVHEKAVQALVDFHFDTRRPAEEPAGRLRWQVPLDLVVIDIGGGLRPGCGPRIRPEDLRSEPMRAVARGLSLPGAWDNAPVPVDFGSFMSSLTRTMAPELATPRQLGQNLAVVSREYANISLRLGYHFTMIDSYVSERTGDNSIYFRFFGGVTDSGRRARRARFLEAILAARDFRVEVRGDLVVARLKRLHRRQMLERLTALGVLVGFTRQLDVRLTSDERIRDSIAQFNALMEDSHGR